MWNSHIVVMYVIDNMQNMFHVDTVCLCFNSVHVIRVHDYHQQTKTLIYTVFRSTVILLLYKYRNSYVNRRCMFRISITTQQSRFCTLSGDSVSFISGFRTVFKFHWWLQEIRNIKLFSGIMFVQNFMKILEIFKQCNGGGRCTNMVVIQACDPNI